MSPTTRGAAFEAGSKGSDPIQMYLEDLFTIPANLAGLPALSIPNGMIESKPIGLQLIGQRKSLALSILRSIIKNQ